MTRPAPTDLPLFARAGRHGQRIAIAEPGGAASRYQDLLQASGRAAAALLAGRADLAEARIAYLIPPGFPHVAVQWGIWGAGGVAVPLAPSHPPAEWEFVLRDAGVETVVVGAGVGAPLRERAGPLGFRLLPAEQALTSGEVGEAASSESLPRLAPSRRALIIYTSGTTARPKGVVITHANLEAQVTSLAQAWGWTPRDRVLLVLPLHHVHGVVNVLTTALWAGAACEMLPGFEAGATWDRLASGEITLLMAVPTIYRRLIAAWEATSSARQRAWSAGAARLRLMVSGSAALPVRTLECWRDITGHTLLERYGMTEIGMALSNPLAGERRPGFVGLPLPGVDVRLVDEAGGESAPGQPGEIEVRGATVFREYWNRPEASEAAFHDGWFRTGDVAVWERGAYRILGRASTDIIKTGGYKVSALEIEDALREHPAIAECAVVGLPDEEWGERVAVAVEVGPGAVLDLGALRAWARDRLAPYKLPRALAVVEALPRNPMGKVNKPELVTRFPRTTP